MQTVLIVIHLMVVIGLDRGRSPAALGGRRARHRRRRRQVHDRPRPGQRADPRDRHPGGDLLRRPASRSPSWPATAARRNRCSRASSRRRAGRPQPAAGGGRARPAEAARPARRRPRPAPPRRRPSRRARNNPNKGPVRRPLFIWSKGLTALWTMPSAGHFWLPKRVRRG